MCSAANHVSVTNLRLSRGSPFDLEDRDLAASS